MSDPEDMEVQQPNKITTQQFSAKFRSKKEVYYFLTYECNAYLPSYKTISIYFLKDLIRGKKKCKSYHLNF